MNIHLLACLNIVVLIALSCAMALVLYAFRVPDSVGLVAHLVVVGYAMAALGRMFGGKR